MSITSPSAEHWTEFIFAVGNSRSESLLFFRTYRRRHRVGRLDLVVAVVTRQFAMSSPTRSEDIVVKRSCHSTSPLCPSDASSSSHCAGRPDAAMRCNFRFRLELVVLVVLGIAVASATSVATSPVANCPTAAFKDVISRAVRASIVFEGHITSSRRHTDHAAAAVSSKSPPSDVTSGACHVTFKVKRLIKGELPSVTRSDGRRSDERSSSSSALEEFQPVVVRTHHVVSGGQIWGGKSGRGDGEDEDWCAAASERRSRTNYVVFLSNAEEVEGAGIDNGGRSRPGSSSNRNKRVRGGMISTTLFQFSSPPLESSKDVIRQLPDFNNFGARAPGAKLTSPSKGKQQPQQASSHRVGGRVQLTCRAVNSRPAVVAFVWTKDGVCLHSGNRTKITQNKAKLNSQLLIKSATLEDRGVYSCQAINVVGHSTVQQITVDVRQHHSKEPLTMIDAGDASTVPSALQHKRPCDESDASYCHNGGICNILLNKKFCNCTSEFEGLRCQEKRNVINLDNEDLGVGNVRLSLRRKKRMHTPVT